MNLDHYMDELRRGLRHLPNDERAAILSEIRAHIQERINEGVAGGLSRKDATDAAIEAFGDASEVAVMYTPEGTVVRGRAGEIALDVAVRTGRGVGTVLRYTLFTVLGLIGIAVVAALVLAVAYKDVIQDGIDTVAEHRFRDVGERQSTHDATTSQFTDRFEIEYPVRDSDLWIRATPDGVVAGCIQVTVSHPDGTFMFDSGPVCGDTLSWQGSPVAKGRYAITYTLVGWSGTIQADGHVIEIIPKDDR